jgi:hypothetical protein
MNKNENDKIVFDFDGIETCQLKLLKNALDEEFRQREYRENKHFYSSLIRTNDIVILPSPFEYLEKRDDMQSKIIYTDILIHSKSECNELEISLERELHREFSIQEDLKKYILPSVNSLVPNYEKVSFERSERKCKCFYDCKLHVKVVSPLYLYSLIDYTTQKR